MSGIQIGQTVRVKFNGHIYQSGEVVELSKKRFKVRFSTNSGRVRSTWFRQDFFRATGIACSSSHDEGERDAPLDSVAPGILLAMDRRREEHAVEVREGTDRSFFTDEDEELGVIGQGIAKRAAEARVRIFGRGKS